MSRNVNKTHDVRAIISERWGTERKHVDGIAHLILLSPICNNDDEHAAGLVDRRMIDITEFRDGTMVATSHT